MALINLLCMYPDLAVRTAVSTSDSLPDTDSIKNSVGSNPRLKELEMKPRSNAPRPPRLKWAKTLSL